MKIKRTMTLEISPKEIKNILINYLKDEGYNSITENDITFDIGEKPQGYGYFDDGKTIPYFRSVLVKADKEVDK